MNSLNNTKQYRVTVEVFTWAEDSESALEQVIGELDYLCELENNLAGYILPRTAVEDKE